MAPRLAELLIQSETSAGETAEAFWDAKEAQEIATITPSKILERILAKTLMLSIISEKC